MSDLVKRLRDTAHGVRLSREAAARIEALEAENTRLKLALGQIQRRESPDAGRPFKKGDSKMNSIVNHLFRRNAWVNITDLVAATNCHLHHLHRLVELKRIERRGEEYRITPEARRKMLKGFDEYGHYGECNPPLARAAE